MIKIINHEAVTTQRTLTATLKVVEQPSDSIYKYEAEVRVEATNKVTHERVIVLEHDEFAFGDYKEFKSDFDFILSQTEFFEESTGEELRVMAYVLKEVRGVCNTCRNTQ